MAPPHSHRPPDTATVTYPEFRITQGVYVKYERGSGLRRVLRAICMAAPAVVRYPIRFMLYHLLTKPKDRGEGGPCERACPRCRSHCGLISFLTSHVHGPCRPRGGAVRERRIGDRAGSQ